MRSQNTKRIRMLARCGLLSALAIVLQWLEFPLPFLPPWLKLDVSTLPVLLAGFSMGPVAGLAVQAVKSALHIFWGSTGGVGELADFLMGSAFVLPAALLYLKQKNLRAAVTGLGLGVLAMTLVGALSNYYIMLPLYTQGMGMDAVLAAAGAKNANIVDAWSYILYGVLPFNLIKGLLVSVVTLLLYKRVSPLLHDKPERKPSTTTDKKDA